MARELRLPELGENIESAEIIKVLVGKGDKVNKDQVILEIETDKATIEVPSEFDGIVSKVFVNEGENASIGDVIFELTESDMQKNDTEKKATPKTKKSGDEKIISKKEVKVNDQIIEIVLPELGENILTASVIKVPIKKGDVLIKDQTILEIETDKATVEVPSEYEGTVLEVNVKEGEEAKVGQVIFKISGGNVNIPTSQPAKNKVAEPEISDEKRETISTEVKNQSVGSARINELNIVPAAPSVRRFAREIGIQISQVRGSGPGGRISVEDVKLYSKRMNEKISSGEIAGFAGTRREPLPDFSKWGKVQTEKMSNIRKKTAEHLSYAWNSIPHVTQFDKADITELEKLRKKFSKTVENQGGKLTVTAVLVKIIASALKVFPQFNTSLDMERHEIIYKNYFNVGIAVDTDRGLLVPVIRNVDQKNIVDIAKELTVISEKARNKKLTLEDMQGGSFTISNLGSIGGTAFTPIVNSPEVAILGVSRGSYEPVFIDGEFQPRMRLPLSLSYDHRIIDGADAARFIRWVSTALENPFLLSLEG